MLVRQLDAWLASMVAADQKVKNKDYIIEGDKIRMVHPTTTGRVDRESLWGNKQASLNIYHKSA